MKQVIVMRKDLNMRKGKMIAQGAHASLKVVLESLDTMEDGDPLDQWLKGIFTKIVVSVNSEDELLKAVAMAKFLNIKYALIKDAGVTEFRGVHTLTCCAIGPDEPAKIDQITGHLKLL